jgi:hypothetical protein
MFRLAILAFVGIGVFAPIDGHIPMAQGSGWMQTSRTIGIAMAQYANDHGGNYPDGQSSTEVFQKLLDGNYVTDPGIFYVPYAGKVKAVSGQSLKPENVSWDVTAGVESQTSDEIPIVFLTGYRVTYAAGGAAVSLVKPFPDFGDPPRTWSQWWHGEPKPMPRSVPGIAVMYKSNTAAYKMFMFESTPAPEGTMPDFISSKFDPKDRVYHQLTPTGQLPNSP